MTEASCPDSYAACVAAGKADRIPSERRVRWRSSLHELCVVPIRTQRLRRGPQCVVETPSVPTYLQ